MKISIIFILLLAMFILPEISQAQQKNKKYNPCVDSIFLAYKKMNIDSLSQRQYEYFTNKEKECAEYNKTVMQTNPNQQIADQYSENSGLIYVLVVIGILSAVGYFIISLNNK